MPRRYYELPKEFRNSEYLRFNKLAEKFVNVVEYFEKEFDGDYNSPLIHGLNMDIDSDLLYYFYVTLLNFKKNALNVITNRYSKEFNQSKIPACARKLISLQNGIRNRSANLNAVYTAMDELLTAYNNFMNLALDKEKR